VELLAIGFDILDLDLDGLEARKLVNDHAIGLRLFADVDPGVCESRASVQQTCYRHGEIKTKAPISGRSGLVF
jgi:hypothetical protein